MEVDCNLGVFQKKNGYLWLWIVLSLLVKFLTTFTRSTIIMCMVVKLSTINFRIVWTKNL